MKAINRDLLVLNKKVAANKKELELEVESLNKILLQAEAWENLCAVSEVIDVNNYKIISDKIKISRTLSNKKLKPFLFINNKN